MVRHNRLKYLSSFVADRLLEERQSDISGKLQVYLSQGKIKLCTKNATYSFEEYYSVFEKGFAALNIGTHNFKNVLLLGFGLGSVLILLKRIYALNFNCTAVELDAAIINLAQKYIDPKFLVNTTIVNADAYDWVLQNKTLHSTFDLIIVDLFVDKTTESKFFENTFIKHNKALLNKNGLLLYNTLSSNKNKKQLKQYFSNQFNPLFKQSELLKIGYNNLLVGYS